MICLVGRARQQTACCHPLHSARTTQPPAPGSALSPCPSQGCRAARRSTTMGTSSSEGDGELCIRVYPSAHPFEVGGQQLFATPAACHHPQGLGHPPYTQPRQDSYLERNREGVTLARSRCHRASARPPALPACTAPCRPRNSPGILGCTPVTLPTLPQPIVRTLPGTACDLPSMNRARDSESRSKPSGSLSGECETMSTMPERRKKRYMVV